MHWPLATKQKSTFLVDESLARLPAFFRAVFFNTGALAKLTIVERKGRGSKNLEDRQAGWVMASAPNPREKPKGRRHELQKFLLMTGILMTIALGLSAGQHSAGNGSGLLVFSTEEEIIQVEGACVDWNFQKDQDGTSPVVASILVNLDSQSGTTIAGLGSAMINLGDAFWAFEIEGDIDHSDPVYSFVGLAKNLKAPQDQPVSAKIKVTCN